MKNEFTNHREHSERRRFLSKLAGLATGASLFGAFSSLFGQAKPLVKSDQTGKNKLSTIYSPALGQIAILAGADSTIPSGWAACHGQLLSISQNTALFSLLGSYYGGNGSTTFGLPDLRGRAPVGVGQGAGLSSYSPGQRGGEESHTLAQNELPQHTHTVAASNSAGSSSAPSGNFPAASADGIQQYGTSGSGSMNSTLVGNAGSGSSHNNLQPYVAVTYIIATAGIFPTP